MALCDLAFRTHFQIDHQKIAKNYFIIVISEVCDFLYRILRLLDIESEDFCDDFLMNSFFDGKQICNCKNADSVQLKESSGT